MKVQCKELNCVRLSFHYIFTDLVIYCKWISAGSVYCDINVSVDSVSKIKPVFCLDFIPFCCSFDGSQCSVVPLKGNTQYIHYIRYTTES